MDRWWWSIRGRLIRSERGLGRPDPYGYRCMRMHVTVSTDACCFFASSRNQITSRRVGGEGRRQDCSCCRCVKSPLASHPTPRRPTQARPLLFLLFRIALPLRRARPFVSWTWTRTCMIMRAHSLVSPRGRTHARGAARRRAVAVAWQQAGLQEHRRWRWRIGMCRWAYRQVTSRVRPMASGTLRAENDGRVPQPFLSRDGERER